MESVARSNVAFEPEYIFSRSAYVVFCSLNSLSLFATRLCVSVSLLVLILIKFRWFYFHLHLFSGKAYRRVR